MFSEPTPENLLILFRPGLPGFNLDPFSNPTPRKEDVVSAFFLRQIGSLESETRLSADPFSNPTPRKEEVVSAFFLRQIGSLESESRLSADPFSNPTPRKEEVVSAFFLRQIGSLEDSTPGRHTVRVLRVSLPSPTPTPHTETPPHQETKFVVTSHCLRRSCPYPRIDYVFSSDPHPRNLRVSSSRPLPWDLLTHPPTKKPRPRKFLQHSPCGRVGLLTSLRSSPSRASRALAFAPLRGALCVLTRHRSKPFGFSRVAEAVGRCARCARAALREGGGNR